MVTTAGLGGPSGVHFRRLAGLAWARVRVILPQRADVAAMRRSPRRDLVAGLTVAVVALPLALAFGAASGLGAGAGLITAIVAGLLAAVFGGSNLQVSGPTGAMTVVLLPIVAAVGVSGVLVVGLLAGLLLIALAFAGAGRFMQYVPLPVVEGFTVGIAVIIGLQQVPAALGQQGSQGTVVLSAWNAGLSFLADPNWAALGVAALVAASMLVGLRVKPGLPVSLPAVAVASAAVLALGLPVATIGSLPSRLPEPRLPAIPWEQLSSLLLPAVAVAALAALESLLSATVADAMTVGEHHDPNRELFGQGVANVVVPLFGGVAATAAIARTAVNVRTGAQSRLASITHSVTLLLIVLAASRWVSLIPLAALAGVLFATVVQMVKVSSLRALLRSTRGDAVVLIATATATVAFDLVVAVIIGLVTAGVAALVQMARVANVAEIPLVGASASAEEQELLDRHVIAFRLDGPLFFAAAHRFLLEVTEVSEVRVVILRLSRIHTLDATGARVLGDTIMSLERRGITVLLSGIKDEHDSVFAALGVYDQLASAGHVFATTPEAIAYSGTLLPREGPER